MPIQQAPNVGLSFGLDQGESGWRLPMDENLRAIDALMFPDVISMTTDVPASPSAGERYIVPVGATGDWTGHDGKYARFDGSAWELYTPRKGWRAYVEDASTYKRHNGTNWASDISTTIAENKGIDGAGGSGTGIFLSKVGAVLGFKSLVPGSNVSFDTTTDQNQIIINSSASGGTGGISDAPNDGNAYVRKALGWVRGITRGGDTIRNIAEVWQVITTGAAIDWSQGMLVDLTLSQNETLTFSNFPVGQHGHLLISGGDIYTLNMSAVGMPITWRTDNGLPPELEPRFAIEFLVNHNGTEVFGYPVGAI